MASFFINRPIFAAVISVIITLCGGIAVMLAGKAGAFITGQTIIADAGVTIGG